jgi:hypothetical protein
VQDKRADRPVRWSARIAFLAGMAASVAANIAAAHPSLGARIVAAWPAIALLLVVEMLARTRYRHGPRSRSHDARRDVAVRNLLESSGDGIGLVSMARSAGSTTPRRSQVNGRATPSARRNAGVNREPTATSVARIREERPDASFAEIATEAGLSERHVRRLLRARDSIPEEGTA